ncbi:MAG: F0F1 ATP synthase subunit A [Oscillospiraceae bacterium]|nr:F0F1 ATP synthase subunit A [Oscillospiraceae bacterium]
MSGKKRRAFLVVWLCLIAALAIAALLVGSNGEKEAVTEVMRDAVLHENDAVSLFGLMEVNPAVISGFLVTIVLLVFAACVRIFAIPRFKMVPGKFQMLLEQLVGFFDNLAKENSPHRNGFLGVYIFAAGVYIFIGTLFELLGIQVVTVAGVSVALPAPLSDINGAIMMGCLSYLVILSGGIAGNGLKGVGLTLKDFSLPISMSFRLFGALLSGLLVTELVYYYMHLSFVLPVVVGVLFTLLHALIQTYVLTMLTSLFYGEVSERSEKPPKEKKKRGGKKAQASPAEPGQP